MGRIASALVGETATVGSDVGAAVVSPAYQTAPS